MPTYGGDLIGNGISSADTTLGGSPPEYAIDGDINTRWLSTNTAPPHWWQYNFLYILVDETGAGTASADSINHAGVPASNAFDNDSDTLWYSANTAFPHWLKYDFGLGVTKVIKSYSIIGGSTVYSPKDFKFQGSNDGSSWDDLDIQTGQIFVDSEEKSYTNFSEGLNTTAYQYYRFYSTLSNDGGNFIGIAEVSMEELLEDRFVDIDTDRMQLIYKKLGCRIQHPKI